MKNFTIINANNVVEVGHADPPMKNEDFHLMKFEIDGAEDMECSDGYHTFGELYEHRITLFIALCKSTLAMASVVGEVILASAAWRSKLHSDGSNWDGWFILGIGKEKGKQITYHLPISKWDETEFAETLEKAPEWDGHTPEDVLERLKNL